MNSRVWIPSFPNAGRTKEPIGGRLKMQPQNITKQAGIRRARPTVTQLKILRRLAATDGRVFIHRCSHSNVNTPDSYFYSSSGMEYVPGVTVRLLEKRGWVEDFEALDLQWRGSKYRITKEGRAVVLSAAPPSTGMERAS